MSEGKGKPVFLTNGERRLLLRLVESTIEALDESPVEASDKQAAWLNNLRQRQFRRIALELRLARPEPPERQVAE